MSGKNILSLLSDISNDLNRSVKEDALLEKILQNILKFAQANIGFILLIENTKEELHIRMSKGVKKLKQKTIAIGEGIHGFVAKEGEALLLSNCKKDSRFKKTIELGSTNVTNLMAIPLKVKNKIVGVLSIGNEDVKAPFTDELLNMMNLLSSFVALCVENINLNKQIEDYAIIDENTQLYNMRFFRKLLDRELHRAERYGAPLSLILVNVDSLKNVNNNHGYLMGNQALKEMADLLKDNVRAVDEVCRYAGDEFIIILPQTDYHQAFFSAERLRTKIEEYVFLISCGLKLNITASFGLSSYPQHATGKDELIRQANIAVHKAKEKGGNIALIAG